MELQQITEGSQVLFSLCHRFGDRHQFFRRALFVRAGARLALLWSATVAARLVATTCGRWPFRRRFWGAFLRWSLSGLRLRCLMRPIVAPAPLARWLRRSDTLGARGYHREGYATPIFVDRRYPSANLIAHCHHVVRIADITSAELADMNETAVGNRHIYKRTEIDYVEHSAPQLHTGLQILELDYVLTKDRRRQVLARVATRPAQ